jgi:hypothetical protein
LKLFPVRIPLIKGITFHTYPLRNRLAEFDLRLFRIINKNERHRNDYSADWGLSTSQIEALSFNRQLAALNGNAGCDAYGNRCRKKILGKFALPISF